jgi:hypothetical protein
MKTIINSLLIITLLLFFSCSNKNGQNKIIDNNGKMVVLNGKGISDTVLFQCLGCKENIKDTSVFNSIFREASLRVKNKLSYPLSFDPVRIEITTTVKDSLIDVSSNKLISNVLSVIAKYFYTAKNGYGNELEGNSYVSFYFKDSKIEEIEDKIKLDSLQFNDKIINRTLSLYTPNEDASIEIIPSRDKSLIVITSLNCVDENAWLVIKLENDTEIRLTSWNDFNCEGRAYFNKLSASQQKQLASSPVKFISFVDKKSVSCIVPPNEKDYFIQLISL